MPVYKLAISLILTNFILPTATFGTIFTSLQQIRSVKKYLLFFFLFTGSVSYAQKIQNIYVNLYTDSLKKGTYNYINIDGLLENGRYLPLDSSHIIFSCSSGKFYGNTLWLDRDCKEEKINIKAVLRSNHSVQKEFVIFIKTKEDNEKLRTADEIINGTKKKKNH